MKYVSSIQNGKIQTSGILGKEFAYASDEELVTLVIQLINKGYAFVDEPVGWPPAAILQELQSKGKLDMSFTAITWTRPNEHRIYEITPR